MTTMRSMTMRGRAAAMTTMKLMMRGRAAMITTWKLMMRGRAATMTMTKSDDDSRKGCDDVVDGN